MITGFQPTVFELGSIALHALCTDTVYRSTGGTVSNASQNEVVNAMIEPSVTAKAQVELNHATWKM
jgi:hypothetical protein